MASSPEESDLCGRPSIAILGGGIAGLALAIGLIKRNVPCTIFEAADRFSAIGAGIGLGPNSLGAMDLIDPVFRAKYDSVKTTNEREAFKHSIFDALYAEEGFGANRGWSGGLVGAPYFERSSAHRKDLLEIMESLVPLDTVRFSKRATGLREATGGRVLVTFADGDSLVVDAVIGADGIRGITRSFVLARVPAPERQIAPVYTGTYAYRGIIPMKDAKDILGEHGGDAKWFMASGRGLVMYPISKGTQANIIFFVKDDGDQWARDDGATVACSTEEMQADLANFDRRLKRLLDWVRPVRWPLFHHPNTARYYDGRVCLVGDVAHAMTPFQAAGAGQGLEDAAVLAHLLALVREPGELQAAFSVYDGVRRPRADRTVATSAEAGLMYAFSGPHTGDNLQKIVDDANQRFHWLWRHDIQADLVEAQERFLSQVETARAKSI